MYFTGFADEAAPDLAGQIRATQELGWKNIESRNIDGVNIHDLPEDRFERACAELEESGVGINCFGSTIANWGKSIEDPNETSLEETKRAIPRMQKLGTKLVRIMSYGIIKGRSPDDQLEEERFKKLREIVSMFTDAGLKPVHENCMNYGGMAWKYTLRLLENVPGMELVFDTGNPPKQFDMSKAEPYPIQSTWEFYENVKDHIGYIHIKDSKFVRYNPEEIFSEAEYFFPGEGNGDVEKVLKDLIANGYDGGISIEPHMAVVFHSTSGDGDEAGIRYSNYVEYGRRLMTMIDRIKADSSVGSE